MWTPELDHLIFQNFYSRRRTRRPHKTRTGPAKGSFEASEAKGEGKSRHLEGYPRDAPQPSPGRNGQKGLIEAALILEGSYIHLPS